LPAALPRTQIPTASIGPGWTAALYSANRVQPSWEEGPTVLYLVSPTGDRYEVAAWQAGGPEPWAVWNLSNSGAQILVTVWYPSDFHEEIVAIDVASGAQSTVLVVPEIVWATAGTTLPTGRDVVVMRSGNTTESLDVFRTDGSLWAAIAEDASARPDYSWLYGLDGMFLVVGDGSGLSVYANDGTYLRDLDTPFSVCEPARWWDASTVLARCIQDTVWAANGYYHELWLVPLDGSVPTPLTAATPANWDFVEFGHYDAWQVGGQVMLQWWGDCAARGIQVLQPDGTGAGIGNGPDGAEWIVARAGNDLVVHSVLGCGDYYGPLSLIRTDGSVVRTLVPRIADFEGVIDARGMTPVP
jgi:TolB protein